MDLLTELRRVYTNTVASEFRISRRLGELDDTPLNYYSMMYLNIIYTMDDCTVKNLSRILGVNKSTVSKKIDYLEEHGYVYRERDEKDGRVYHIRLTPKVTKNVREYDRPYINAIQRIQDELSPKEVEALCKALTIYTEEFRGDMDGSGTDR